MVVMAPLHYLTMPLIGHSEYSQKLFIAPAMGFEPTVGHLHDGTLYLLGISGFFE